VTVLLVILQAVLVLVSLLAANDGTLERLDLLANEAANTGKAVKELVLANTLSDLAVVGKGRGGEALVAVALLAQQTLCRIVDGARPAIAHVDCVHVKVTLHELAVIEVVEVSELAVVNITLAGCAGSGRIGGGETLSSICQRRGVDGGDGRVVLVVVEVLRARVWRRRVSRVETLPLEGVGNVDVDWRCSRLLASELRLRLEL